MRVPRVVNDLPPFIASTDFRRSASDHIFFSQVSLIAFTPVVDDVPRFAYRMPPSASPDLPFSVLPDTFLFYPRGARTVTNGKRVHFKILTPSQQTPCFVQRRVAVFFENYRSHFGQYFDDQFC